MSLKLNNGYEKKHLIRFLICTGLYRIIYRKPQDQTGEDHVVFLFAKNKEDNEMRKNNANEMNGFYVAGWMIKDLGLSGTKLLVYAVIYGYSQNGVDDFHESIKSLARFLGIHVNSVSKALADLVEQGLLTKEEENIKGWKLPSHYKVVR